MGRSVMEIARMTMYMFLPIGMYYYFGLPAFHNDHVKPFFVRVTAPPRVSPWLSDAR